MLSKLEYRCDKFKPVTATREFVWVQLQSDAYFAKKRKKIEQH
jgi:hypothetical protein